MPDGSLHVLLLLAEGSWFPWADEVDSFAGATATAEGRFTGEPLENCGTVFDECRCTVDGLTIGASLEYKIVRPMPLWATGSANDSRGASGLLSVESRRQAATGEACPVLDIYALCNN